MPYKDPGSPAALASAKRKREKYSQSAKGRATAAAYAERVSGTRTEYVAAWHQQRAAEDPLYTRRRNLLHRYGLTVDDFDAILDKQDGCCPICGEPFTESRPPVVDHDHVTGAVRGLLHRTCNAMLGWFENNSATITSYVAEGGRIEYGRDRDSNQS